MHGLKRTNLGRKMLFGTPDGSDPITNIEITSSDTLAFYNYDSGFMECKTIKSF